MDSVLHKNFYDFIKDRERRKRKAKNEKMKQKTPPKRNFLPDLPKINTKTGEPDEAGVY